MKLVSAIIKSFKLEAVQEALGNLGFSLTATEVKGFGRQNRQDRGWKDFCL